MSDEQVRLAVLIDADNISAKVAKDIFEELAGYGTLTVKRAYGDWTTTRLNGWKDQLHAHAISPMQQFAYTTGKNSTDSALIIDAMDLLYAGHLDGFVIVSSDSDFTRLATRLREAGKTVYGVGARKTPQAFRDACDKFTFLEVLRADATPDPEPERPRRSRRSTSRDQAGAESREPAQPEATRSEDSTGPADTVDPGDVGDTGDTGETGTEPDLDNGSGPEPTRRNLESMLAKALNKTASDDDDWSALGALGSHLNRTDPSFDARTYGFARLSDLVKAQPFLETRTVKTSSGQGQLWVRLKRRGAARKSAARTEDVDASTPADEAPEKAAEKPAETAASKAPEAVAETAAQEVADKSAETGPVTTPAPASEPPVEEAKPARKATVRKRTTKKTAAAKATAGEPAADQPAADQPVAESPAIEPPVAEKPAKKTGGRTTRKVTATRTVPAPD